MAKITLHKYSVKSVKSNHFPLDMLRYNQCWPESQGDMDKLRAAYYCTEEDKQKAIVVNITGINPPSVERWRSFGWAVNDVRSMKVDQ